MKNLWIRGSLPVSLCLCAQLLAIPSNTEGQTFTTVINVPTDPAPVSIGSDTQLNLFDGGSLANGFDAGVLIGPSSNIEVNIGGGTVGGSFRAGSFGGINTNVTVNITSGIVGWFFTAKPDTTINISGGTIGDGFMAESGSVVNISGGSLGDHVTPYNGSTFNISGGSVGEFFEPRNNTTINISGGTIGDYFSTGYDTTISISGGVVPDLHYVGGGGTLNLSGGNFGGSYFRSDVVTITGSEFLYDGAPISGLESAGGSVSFPTTEMGLLSTTFADGAVFTFYPGNFNGTLILNSVTAPVKPAIINSPSDPAPLGLRAGQTLNLSAGAELVDCFTAIDSTLNVNGGDVGRGLKALGTSVNITGGSVGKSFSARSGSTVNISGGKITSYFNVTNDSELNVSGGVISRTTYLHESDASITGGTVDSIRAGTGSTLNISDGTVGRFITVAEGSTINLSGGTMGEYAYFQLTDNSTANILGSSFILDGVDLTPGLTPGESLTITVRNVLLEGVLADGSPFDFELNSTFENFDDVFESGTTLTITLVPEPGALALMGAGGLMLIRRRYV